MVRVDRQIRDVALLVDMECCVAGRDIGEGEVAGFIREDELMII